MFRRIIGEDDDGTIESDNLTTGYRDHVFAKKVELDAAEPLKLREERNRRLAETDWWPLRSDHARHGGHRQALRDITQTYQSLTLSCGL